MQSTSPFGTLNWVDAWKTVRGGLITFSGFILVQVLTALLSDLQVCVDTPANCQFDFGGFNFFLPTAVTLTGMALEFVRRWFADHTK